MILKNFEEEHEEDEKEDKEEDEEEEEEDWIISNILKVCQIMQHFEQTMQIRHEAHHMTQVQHHSKFFILPWPLLPPLTSHSACFPELSKQLPPIGFLPAGTTS